MEEGKGREVGREGENERTESDEVDKNVGRRRRRRRREEEEEEEGEIDR